MKILIITAIIIGGISGFIQQSFASDICNQDHNTYKRIIKIKDKDIKETLANEILALAVVDNCDTTTW